MRKTYLSLLLLIALAAPAWPEEPTVKLPGEIRAQPGRYVRVPAETNGKEVRWYSPDGLDIFPVELLKDTKTAVVIPPQAGRYRLIAYTALGDVPSAPAICTVVAGDPGPDPGPGPGPGPVPIDPFVKALQAAYNGETEADRAKSLEGVLKVYTAAVANAKRPDLTTWGALFLAMKQDANQFGVLGKIPGVWKAIQVGALSGLPNQSGLLLDDAGRAKAEAAFTKAAKALSQVKP